MDSEERKGNDTEVSLEAAAELEGKIYASFGEYPLLVRE